VLGKVVSAHRRGRIRLSRKEAIAEQEAQGEREGTAGGPGGEGVSAASVRRGLRRSEISRRAEARLEARPCGSTRGVGSEAGGADRRRRRGGRRLYLPWVSSPAERTVRRGDARDRERPGPSEGDGAGGSVPRRRERGAEPSSAHGGHLNQPTARVEARLRSKERDQRHPCPMHNFIAGEVLSAPARHQSRTGLIANSKASIKLALYHFPFLRRRETEVGWRPPWRQQGAEAQ